MPSQPADLELSAADGELLRRPDVRQLPGVAAEEELAERALPLHQVVHGQAPAAVLSGPAARAGGACARATRGRLQHGAVRGIGFAPLGVLGVESIRWGAEVGASGVYGRKPGVPARPGGLRASILADSCTKGWLLPRMP